MHLELSYYGFISYSFRTNRQICPYTTVAASKTIPDSRPKWAKSLTVFRQKRRKSPTFWGGTYLYGLYKGVPPPPSCNTCYRQCLLKLRKLQKYFSQAVSVEMHHCPKITEQFSVIRASRDINFLQI